ncbi:tyrosine-type recombinase/integrase [Diaphorobacter sp. JS3051]|uniref:tyrosine-type recombinase/integrase n=1 Tax=Diaphorobacter sp. JS3051 TaxID=2792224 RepID=UPI0018CAE3DD|nr:tyrosine-type recombinase/integrase [Diaphorobacter sp. JS3051]QPN33376.1 tyrosine-type recombinase/integrase [Diaphorobacter sp. JS3051]
MSESLVRSPAPLRLTRDVLAHLRSVAEGFPVARSARRYLDCSEESAAAVHRAAVDIAAAVARRAGLGPRWRLLRVPQLPAQALAAPVSIEEWAESKGYDGFSYEELREIYEAENGPLGADRKTKQIERMRRARMELLQQLEAYAVEPPSIGDPVSAWFPEDLAARLQRAGFHLLGELRAAIVLGGRWWRGLPGYGPVKAGQLAAQVGALVGWPPAPTWAASQEARGLVEGAHQLIEQWIAARTESEQTGRAYRREVQRYLVWLVSERRKALADAGPDDCAAYIAFLRAVPVEWMSRRNAARFREGWAPFASQPSIKSQRYALTVVNAFFAWLARTGELRRNPWDLVNLRLPDDPDESLDSSRAFTPAAWTVLHDHVPQLPPAAAARMRWLLEFAQGTGLRAAELLLGRRADIRARDGGYWVRVHGKGARNRFVVVPTSAMRATRAYFSARGLDFDHAHPNTPLLARLDVPELPGMDAREPGQSAKRPDAEERRQRGFLSYPTLAPAFKRFVRSALRASSLSHEEREGVRQASLHWLRHTHATRAAEAEVPPDVLQANLGQADPRTTAGYYRAQEQRRMRQMERAFGEAGGG